MSVNIDQFVDAMTDHWEARLGNATNTNLKLVWRQIGEAFNFQIRGLNDGQLKVLQPATGTGKTQCIVVYCAMVASMRVSIEISSDPHATLVESIKFPTHPGALVIVRRKAQADELAEQINKLAGKITAKVSHADSRLSENDMVASPVLIITHAAYTNALRAKKKSDKTNSNHDENWSRINAWHHGKRQLVIIDEALDLVDHFELDTEVAKQALAFIPDYVGAKFPNQIKYLNDLKDWLQRLAIDNKSERMLPSDCMLSNCPDFSELRKALKTVRLDRNVNGENNSGSNRHLHNKIHDTFDAIDAMTGQWSYFSKSGLRGTVNSAQHLLPEDHRGAVVLDATASTNLLYHLFDKRVSVIPTPKGARRYDNVTLHVSEGHKVGKVYLTDNAKAECSKLISELALSLKSAEKILIVCHNDVEHNLLGYEDRFSTLAVCHWGAIDGRNDWQDFDTVVVFGLPYRNSTWSSNCFMAVQGPQQDDWFHASGNRTFGRYSDIREELHNGAMATNVLQVVNRIRCRRVIDTDGNCAPTNIYLLLPQNKIGNAIFQNILKAMPGIKTMKWSYSGAAKKVPKSKYEASLLAYLNLQVCGTISAAEIKRELGIPSTSFENLIKKVKDVTSNIHVQLIDIGVTYDVTGIGRGARAKFIKSTA